MFTPLSKSTVANDGISESAPVSLPSQEPVVKTWHHDCSNASGFEYMEIPNDMWKYSWTYTETELQSDGQSFPMPSIANSSPVYDYCGPVYAYTLPDIFPLSGLRNFSVHMELNNSNPAYCGVVNVGLLDVQYNPVITANILDWHGYNTFGYCDWKYYLQNWSIQHHVLDNDDDYNYERGMLSGWVEFVNGIFVSGFDQRHGLNVSTPQVESSIETRPAWNGTIIKNEEAETARTIKYVVIAFGGYYKYEYLPPLPVFVHDIYLEYELGDVIDTSPPSLTPQGDMVYVVGETGNTIEWRCDDDNPYRYWLLDYKYSYNFEDTNRHEGLWNGSPYAVSVDGLPVGNRTFLLILQDKAGFIVWDRVTVTVIEHPFISFLRADAMVLGLASFTALVCIICYWDDRRTSRSTKKLVPAQAAP
jgi:hypothetical protein